MSKDQHALMVHQEDLIKGCSKGDRASQRALYERYCGKMMVICQRYAKSTQEAEDILQEAFIRIFSSIAGFRGDSKLETWLTRIVINTALNAQRQKMYMLPMVDIEHSGLRETEEISLAGFRLDELTAIIQSLPDGCRVIFNLYAIEGYTHKEISELMGISEGTSKSQYSRAKHLLQSKLNHYDREYGKREVKI